MGQGVRVPYRVEDVNATKTIKNIDTSLMRLTKSYTRLSGAFQNAFQFYVRYRIFNLINRGISAVENAIPGLIARGQEWGQTVDRIADSTGLAAGSASMLAGSVEVMTGNVENADKAFGALAMQVANHGDVLKRYGIETRDANGQMLDTWTILNNIRKVTSDVGNSFVTTAAARDLFSRGGQAMLDYLTMSDEQFKMLMRDVRESGVLMTEAGRNAADQWGRTQRRFEQSVTGIANQITQGVQPLLTRLVDGITNYLRENMASIVGFVTEVIATVANLVAGFLGIDLGLESFAEQFDAAGKDSKRNRELGSGAQERYEQTKTEDAYTRSLNAQIDAIDRQIDAIGRRERAEDAAREQQKILKDIQDAKKELDDLRGQGVFAAGMSAAEAELARQAQAANIQDAMKKVAEEEQKLEEHKKKVARENRRYALQQKKAALQEQLSAHIKALAEQAAADREVTGQIFGEDGTFGAIPEKVGEAIKNALGNAEIGTEWGASLREQFDGFWDELTDPNSSFRQAIKGLTDTIAGIWGFLQDNWQAVAVGLGALAATNLVSSGVGAVKGVGAAASAAVSITKLAGIAGPVGIIVASLAGLAWATNDFLNKINTANADLDEKQEQAKSMSAEDSIGGLANYANEPLAWKNKGGLLSGLVDFAGKTAALGQYEESVRILAENVADDQDISKEQLQTAAGHLSAIVTKLEGEGSSGEEWERILELQAQIEEALGEKGDLAATKEAAQTTADRNKHGGATTASLLADVRRNTAALPRYSPVTNVTLEIDGKAVAKALGIRPGNSSTIK